MDAHDGEIDGSGGKQYKAAQEGGPRFGSRWAHPVGEVWTRERKEPPCGNVETKRTRGPLCNSHWTEQRRWIGTVTLTSGKPVGASMLACVSEGWGAGIGKREGQGSADDCKCGETKGVGWGDSIARSEGARLYDGGGDEAEPTTRPIIEKDIPRRVSGSQPEAAVKRGVRRLHWPREMESTAGEGLVDGPHGGCHLVALRVLLALTHRRGDCHRTVRRDQEARRCVDKRPARLHHPIETGGIAPQESSDAELATRAEALELSELMLAEGAGTRGRFQETR